MTDEPRDAPRRQVGVWEAISVCVGRVIGAGIFRSPSVVAANVGSDLALMLAWAFGGAMSLIGALCFAEMAAAFPDPGGDYHFLRRAFGARAGFLFAWSRFAVIHPGSLAMLAFVFGDYVGELAGFGPLGSAALAQGNTTQHVMRRRQAGVELQRPLEGTDRLGQVALPGQCHALEERMRRVLGTKVILSRSKKGGTIVIHFYSEEELDAIYRRIVS